MARYSSFLCFLLAVLLFTSLGGKSAVEAEQCVSVYDCNGGNDACNKKCQAIFHGVGTCNDPNTPNFCSCKYDCPKLETN
ncbi:unnamed protein product [Linum trigynum]|uniref:Defensin-like protein n=1 Tax=Linum trigynum TaxID=586398 RepID=A0AAV2CKC7_9ROSI